MRPVAIVLVATLGVSMIAAVPVAAESKPQEVRNHYQSPTAPKQIRVQRTAASSQLTFYFGLLRNDAAAQATLLQTSNPKSSRYLQHLTKRQAAVSFGASPQTVAKVKHYLRVKV